MKTTADHGRLSIECPPRARHRYSMESVPWSAVVVGSASCFQRSFRGVRKFRDQPHEPDNPRPAGSISPITPVRSEDERWYSLPTPSHMRPQAVPLARPIEPRAPRGRKNGNFKNGEGTGEAIGEREWLRPLVQSFSKAGTTQ